VNSLNKPAEINKAFSKSDDIQNPDKINREKHQDRQSYEVFFAFFASLSVQRVGTTLI